MFHHRNVDACAPPAPRDPAPLLLSPALSTSAPVLLTPRTAPWRSQDPSHYKLSTFTRGPKQSQGSRKCNLCLLVRQAGCPNRRPGGDCETQHQDSLYRDWRRRAQLVICIVVGSVGNRTCSTIQILVGKDVTIPQVTAKNDRNHSGAPDHPTPATQLPSGPSGLFYGDVGTAASKMHAYVIHAYQMHAYQMHAYEIHARRPYKMHAY
jgi:hypothetical protein